MKLQNYLREKDVPFEVLAHHATYDSQRMAQSLHVSGHEVAKTVLLRCGGDSPYAVAVLPASRQIDLVKVGRVLGTDRAEFATEPEMHDHCPECEIGALPPFGSCYDMITIVDDDLAEKDRILFEGDTHQESIRMKYSDFCELESPTVAAITTKDEDRKSPLPR